jgi:RNA polymerase sigma-70 factor (ECF subfamily)
MDAPPLTRGIQDLIFPWRGTNSPITMSNHTGDENNRLIVDDDYKLVCLCQKGNMDAFESLVEKHQKKLLNIAYRMIGNYEEACEVVQDAFLSAYRALKKFRGESKFSTWLYSIVMNLSKNRLKQVKTRFHREGLSIHDPGKGGDRPFREDPSAQETSFVEQLEKREIQATVQDCIHRLEDEYREVLILRDIEGFSYEEIRDILKIPDGTVKSRLFRARDALKGSLKKALGDL